MNVAIGHQLDNWGHSVPLQSDYSTPIATPTDQPDVVSPGTSHRQSIMATPPLQVFPYTSLPTEIRYLIMEYALVPGDVYPCAKEPKPLSSSSASKLLRAVFKRAPSADFKFKVGSVDHHVAVASSGGNKQQQSSAQLLKTCKRAYEDGHYIFYSMNTFHLPVGSAHDVGSWFDNLKKEHRCLINSVCLTFSLADITPDVLTEMEKKWLWDLPLKTARSEQRMVSEVAYLLCWRYWQDKIDFLKRWEGLERVELRDAAGEGVGFVGEAFRGLEVKEERGIMDRARERVKGELEGMVGEVGWKAVRKGLMGRGVGGGG